MNDHVTKIEFSDAVTGLQSQINEVKQDLNEVKQDLNEVKQDLGEVKKELTKQAVLAERREDKLDSIIEMLVPNLKKTNVNEEDIKINTKNIHLNKVAISNFQEV